MACVHHKEIKKRIYEVKDDGCREKLKTELCDIKKELATIKTEPMIYIRKALNELMLGMAKNSLESAKQALSLDANSFFGWFILGCCYFETNNYQWAKEAYENALKMNIDSCNTSLYMEMAQDILVNLLFIETIKIKQK